MNEVTATSVVVARMMPSSVKKLRSLFLLKESTAMRAASQKEALGRNDRLRCISDSKQRYLQRFCSVLLRPLARRRPGWLVPSSPELHHPAKIAAFRGTEIPNVRRAPAKAALNKDFRRKRGAGTWTPGPAGRPWHESPAKAFGWHRENSAMIAFGNNFRRFRSRRVGLCSGRRTPKFRSPRQDPRRNKDEAKAGS